MRVKFDRDSSRLMTVHSHDNTVRIWSIPDGALLHTLESEGMSFGYWPPDPDRFLRQR